MQSGHPSLSHLAELLANTRLEIGEPAAPALIELLERLDSYRRGGHSVWVTLIQQQRRGIGGCWHLEVDAQESVCTEIEALVDGFERQQLERAGGVQTLVTDTSDGGEPASGSLAD
ncbi:hypothetical protein FCL40_15905 [Ferrimonas sediminicola]|uniref:Uncharacterized protein n=1 Tax=Ferrimonas sediminicola TaxID=2569538 RepID=A0A4V5NUP5_9GAMM|nr:hypothetical protein [Ferrimonas sediminicola]TKB47332.1 hypothetical protein FCL40_15905 [Ferrimonas sediminicola]